MSKKKNLTGLKFGELTVIEEDVNRRSNRVTWKCLCSCGKTKSITSKHLVAGVINSCDAAIHRSGPQSRSWKGTKVICGKYFTQVKRGAIRRFLVFDITIGDMQAVAERQYYNCALTGLPLKFDTNNGGDASLDRIDSKLGYITGNIQWVHKDVNRMKQEFSETYLKTLCKLITDHDRITKTL